MKIAICCLNSKYIHASLAPWCLKSGVEKFCESKAQCKVLESTINADIIAFADSIINEKPDVISFSCYIWNVNKTFEICEYIKTKTNAVIVIGGPEVSYRAESVLNDNNFIDFVLCGEGEVSFARLVDTLVTNGDFTDVDGLCYREKGVILKNPEAECIGTPPSPYTEDFYDNLKGRIAYLETSRGCPYRCAFCLSGRCSKLRFFDMEQVKTDILNLALSGTKTIKLVDRTFNADSKRANEIIKFILEQRGIHIPENVCFHFEIAGDILTEETFELLKTAPVGLFQLEIGMQSFNEDT